ncbi:hypothetical protein [Actinomycetospora flava]|uniref:Zinc-binding dehydrogenase n=1 Tax=Actinomycetospora flava TaxID=3129232 RepID=A0ABU8MF98_9PSEU
MIDSIGGRQAVDAFARLAGHGTLVAVGHSSGEDTVFLYSALLGGTEAHDRSLVTFYLLGVPTLVEDLSWLAARVGDGTLDPGVAWRGSWDDVGSAVEAMLGRGLHGKAVVGAGCAGPGPDRVRAAR